MQFKFDHVPDAEVVSKVEEELREALVEEDITTISRSGKTITVEGEVPRRFVKFLVKKFLGRQGLAKHTKVIATGPGVFDVYYVQKTE